LITDFLLQLLKKSAETELNCPETEGSTFLPNFLMHLVSYTV